MKSYKIVVTPPAVIDIKDITNYLEKFSIGIAVKYTSCINEAIQSLKTMPSRCALVQDVDLREKGYRWISMRNYTIFFLIDEQEGIVRIERVLYSKREYDVIL